MIAGALIAVLSAAGADYAWPLDLPRVLTSSFGEYRTGRFHAGIDLRTGGIGVPVHAPLDGYVSRVRCSPYGYGKAVYIQLTDGNTAVFGHLDAFAEPLAEYVRRAQHARESYTVNLYPERGEFSVAQGETVAYSGETGVGVPHLHYEIRDSQSRPIDPRPFTGPWPDDTRPVIRKVLLMPDGPGGALNGSVKPLVLDAECVGAGSYRTEPVYAIGRLAAGVEVVDPANAGANRLGVRTARTVLGGKEIFRVVHERLSYSTISGGTVSYHPYLLDRGRFLLQYRWPGNRSEPFSVSPGSGWFEAPLKAEELLIETTDFAGNAASVTVPLKPGRPECPMRAASGAGARTGVQLTAYGDWVLVSVRVPSEEARAPVLEAETATGTKPLGMRSAGEGLFHCAYRPGQDDSCVTLRVRHPRVAPFFREIEVFRRGESAREAGMNGAELTCAPDTPYGALLAWAEDPGLLPTPAVPLRGQAYRIEPSAAPLDEPVSVALPRPNDVENPDRAHIYMAGSRAWSFLGGAREGDRLRARTGKLGTFAVLEDNAAPAVRPFGLKDGPEPRPAFGAHISDLGSGIAEYRVTCDGEWMLVAFDPENGVLKWARDEDLAPGRHTIVFTVDDRAGNRTVKEVAIQVAG